MSRLATQVSCSSAVPSVGMETLEEAEAAALEAATGATVALCFTLVARVVGTLEEAGAMLLAVLGVVTAAAAVVEVVVGWLAATEEEEEDEEEEEEEPEPPTVKSMQDS